MVRGWEVGLEITGWTSNFKSVHNLLRYLKYQKIGSECSRNNYGYNLNAFCEYINKLPDDIVKLEKSVIEKLVEDYYYHKRGNGCSIKTVNLILFILKKFFELNGFKGDQHIDVESFYQPVRSRTRPEYIPTSNEANMMANMAGSLRNNAIILFIKSTGLRNSTMRAILYGEIKDELDRGEKYILIRVHKEMKEIVPAACKGNTEYITFTSDEFISVLNLYLEDRRRKYGEIQDHEPLFHSECNRISIKERVTKPLTARELQIIVKNAARSAGLKEWRKVTPTSLRKTYRSALSSQLIDGGKLDLNAQEFHFGHILGGSRDTYYDKSKIEELRKEYSKIVFTPINEELVKAKEILQSIAQFFGIDNVNKDSYDDLLKTLQNAKANVSQIKNNQQISQQVISKNKVYFPSVNRIQIKLDNFNATHTTRACVIQV